MQRGLPLLAALIVGCAPAGDDDDSARVIPPPSGCNLVAQSTVVFQFHIHWSGVDYPQDELVQLLQDSGLTEFVFPFDGAVTELGADPSSDFDAVTVTEVPPEGGEPLDDLNWLRVVYQLPLGYELPVAPDEPLRVELNLNLSGADLISAFSLWELPADAEPALLFLAEPSELGLAYPPGEGHPLFDRVVLRDLACPNISAAPCASVYNLALDVTTHADGAAGGESFELWPTESVDFTIGGPELRLVNAWSYTYREVQNCNNGFDYGAERKSFFVTRSAWAP